MDEKRKNRTPVQKRTLRELIAYARPELWLAVVVLLLSVGVAGTTSLLIYQLKIFIDRLLPEALNNKELPLDDVLHKVLWFIIFIALLLFFDGLFKGGELLVNTRFGQSILRRMRRDIFNHLQYLSLDYYEGEHTGGIMSYTTTDVMKLREFLQIQWPKMVQGTLLVLFYLGFMLVISWKLTLLSFIVFPLLLVLIQIGAKAIRRISLAVQERLADISRVLQETIANIMVVKSFTAEEYEKSRFEVENRDTYKAEIKRAAVQAVLIPPMQFLGAVAVGIFLYLGTREVRQTGELTSGQLMTVVIFLQQLSTEAVKVGRGYFNLQESLAAADRIFGFLKLKSSITDPDDAEEFPSPAGEVIFESVSFSYPTSDVVLTDIDLHARPGRSVALVGASGAGKTTLVKLIPRFYDVSSGRVLVDGHDVRRLKLKDLRSIMGIVPQQTVLFSGTVRENIAYGKPLASQDEIESAAKAANAHDFILGLPEGYNTIVGERGTKLSGGQAQRVAIARAILKDPKILILDEATSNLDAESEKLVQNALDRLMKGRTSFVIAHRLSTILNADEIVVMDHGRIIAKGTHDELLKGCETYRRLYETQLASASQ